MEEQTAKRSKKQEVTDTPFNPLRNEKVTVRFIPHGGFPQAGEKGHVMWGAKADGTTSTFVVPVLRSTNTYKNVLTNDEKDFLEKALRLDNNALSVYNKVNNYWDDFSVTINNKEGLQLDLSNPEHYIVYKVLLANSDQICPSVQELEARPKQTYDFVLVRSKEETELESAKFDASETAYIEFGKISSDLDLARTLIEIVDGRPYRNGESREFLRSRASALIREDAKKFVKAIQDPMLREKMLVKRGAEYGVLAMRGDFYYVKSDGTPLCSNGENPTLEAAANYISLPANQELKFLLENEVEKHRR